MIAIAIDGVVWRSYRPSLVRGSKRRCNVRTLKELPKWFRHLLGSATCLVIIGLSTVPRTPADGSGRGRWGGEPYELLILGGIALGLVAWVYIAKAGEVRKRDRGG